MTWLLGIKLYASASLLFSVGWAVIGYRWNARRERDEARREYRFWSSRVVEHDLSELPPVIRAKELIL